MPSIGRLPIYGQDRGPRLPETRRWRSLDELAGGAEAEPGEFPEGAAEPPAGLSRRGFLQILGASAALAGLEACKPPRERVVSYVRRPVEVTPSVPSAYATAARAHGYGVGLVVTSREGRPVKIEGNRDHPASLGAAGAFEQALVLDLYDPARISGFRRKGRALGFAALLGEISELAATLQKDGGARLRFLVEPSTSPTLAELRRRILDRFPKARFDAWAPVGDDAAREGARIAFGRPLDAAIAPGTADVILALDSDFLGIEPDALRHARDFGARRLPGKLNRLYAAEAGYSITGGFADHRFRMRSAEVASFARAVAAELAAKHGLGALAPLGAPASGEDARRVAAVAADLAKARGRSLVVAGARQPPAVHALAAAMNDALGNLGATISYRAPALLDPDAGPGRLRALAQELDAGQVDTLVITAWNPAYTAPADLNLRALLRKAPNSMYLTPRADRTAESASWVLAQSHVLESWGDLRARDGTVSIVQPLIAPLYESTTEIDLLAAFLDEGDRGAYRHVREGWARRAPGPDFDRRWEEWLSAGVVPGSATAVEKVAVDPARVAGAVRALPAPKAGGVEVNFAPDYKVLDGRFVENAWLQELPHPIAKLTWENAIFLSPKTAQRLGAQSGDYLVVSYRGRLLSGPAFIQPGHADEAVTLPLGYGQAVAGAVGRGVGFDAYAIRTADAPWFDAGAELTKGGRSEVLAVTQGHFSMEGRAIALAFDAPEFEKGKSELDEHRGAQATLLAPVDYSAVDYKWGMAIDLTKCIGCGACTIACQAENNVPVVGRDQVLRSREMHWLRVDRYFEGTSEDPLSVSQPLACVHCEAAPCEYVCPVNATVHSDEGLNEMIYNRCVGTRYCSNNCPYKVRRFNWLDFHGDVPPTLKMLQNPDVTVRGRGVMEKCTYCIQRIERARIDARVNGRKVGGNEVVPACAQACPSEAIVFGNLNDPASNVAKLHGDERRYDLLHELGTRPRTAYLVKLRNPNPDLA